MPETTTDAVAAALDEMRKEAAVSGWVNEHADRLLAAVEAVLKRHQPKTVTVRQLCAAHAGGGWDGKRTAGEQFDACPDCTTRQQVCCSACDPLCPDDNTWPCPDVQAISAALLGEENPGGH